MKDIHRHRYEDDEGNIHVSSIPIRGLKNAQLHRHKGLKPARDTVGHTHEVISPEKEKRRSGPDFLGSDINDKS